MSCNKPLILLKILLFCFYGAGSFSTGFLTLDFKQRGVTLAELSTTYMISPIVQIGATLLSGIIADKIGRSKPVLATNMALTLLALVSIMCVPRPDSVDCDVPNAQIECASLFNTSASTTKCNETQFDENLCHKIPSTNSTKKCMTQAEISSYQYEKNETIEIKKFCNDKHFTMCKSESLNGTFCSVVCNAEMDTKCYEEGQRSILSKVIMLLYILWMTAYSNAYRMLDVAAMYLVTEHNADYGRQRLFCMIGNVILSSLAGLLVNVTNPKGGERDNSAAFYLFISLIGFCILVTYKLDIPFQPPGKKMGKKALILLKNPDIVVFAVVLLILGTSWVFTTKFVYWYLEELNAPSVLIGLVPAMGALYGLPFLFKSEWWMKTIGTTKFLIIGLLGYVIYGIGYSFIKEPWLSVLLESTSVVTYHLLWVAVILRSHEIAPEGLTATVISAAGSIHFQIGKASGSLIARVIMDNFGGPAAYRFLAGMCFVVAVLYTIYIYSRKCYKNKSQDFGENETKDGEKTMTYIKN